jgi:hypothetical protein
MGRPSSSLAAERSVPSPPMDSTASDLRRNDASLSALQPERDPRDRALVPEQLDASLASPVFQRVPAVSRQARVALEGHDAQVGSGPFPSQDSSVGQARAADGARRPAGGRRPGARCVPGQELANACKARDASGKPMASTDSDPGLLLAAKHQAIREQVPCPRRMRAGHRRARRACRRAPRGARRVRKGRFRHPPPRPPRRERAENPARPGTSWASNRRPTMRPVPNSDVARGNASGFAFSNDFHIRTHAAQTVEQGRIGKKAASRPCTSRIRLASKTSGDGAPARQVQIAAEPDVGGRKRQDPRERAFAGACERCPFIRCRRRWSSSSSGLDSWRGDSISSPKSGRESSRGSDCAGRLQEVETFRGRRGRRASSPGGSASCGRRVREAEGSCRGRPGCVETFPDLVERHPAGFAQGFAPGSRARSATWGGQEMATWMVVTWTGPPPGSRHRRRTAKAGTDPGRILSVLAQAVGRADHQALAVQGGDGPDSGQPLADVLPFRSGLPAAQTRSGQGPEGPARSPQRPGGGREAGGIPL